MTVAREEEALDAIALGGSMVPMSLDAALDLLELVRHARAALPLAPILRPTARTVHRKLDLVHADETGRSPCSPPRPCFRHRVR
jgi:hypothetical protein